MTFTPVLAGKIKSCEEVWFLGDNFGFKTYSEHFNERKFEDYDGYTRRYYGTRGFFTNKYSHHDQNAVSRLRNTLAKAITDRVLLPKMVVIVPDNDLIKFAQSADYNRILDNIMKQHNKYIDIQKEYLPERSLRGNMYPQLIWIEPPLHDNFHDNKQRRKFTECLQEATKFHKNTLSLSLKKIWDPQDS